MQEVIEIQGAPPPYEIEEKRLAAVEALHNTYDWIDRDNCVQRNSAVGQILTWEPNTFFLGGSRRMKQIYDERAANNPVLQENSPFKHIQGCGCKTDWDFYATWSEELERELEKREFHETKFSKAVREMRRRSFKDLSHYEQDVLEFLQQEGEYALDDEAIMIVEKDDVQIVLRKDALFYQRVFDNIDPEVYETFLWKSSPTSSVDRSMIQPVFNMLFKIAHAAESK